MKTNNRLFRFASIYREELLQSILPFWINHSQDTKYGGYFTCLDRDGSVYDTDKFMWLQGRGVWCFSTMYQAIGADRQWMDMALLGAEFMKKHGRDQDGNWYFSVDRKGQPLIQPYNIFSDCFASMGFAALDKITPGVGYGTIATDTFENILRRRDNPKGLYNKEYPSTRPLKNFALPMILCNLALEMEHLLGTDRVDSLIPGVLQEIMQVFYQPSLGLIVENVAPDGQLVDSFEGRMLNPGHAVESMWFVMDLARRINDPGLLQRAVDIAISEIEFGWDHQYGGIFYFLDRKGAPPQQLEWDQKLWWVHVEALVAMAKGYMFTGDQRCADWFEKIHDYSWSHFRDEEYGEWYGYLNRRGEVLLPLKGGKWKGCFHIPRALLQVANVLGTQLQPDPMKFSAF